MLVCVDSYHWPSSFVVDPVVRLTRQMVAAQAQRMHSVCQTGSRARRRFTMILRVRRAPLDGDWLHRTGLFMRLLAILAAHRRCASRCHRKWCHLYWYPLLCVFHFRFHLAETLKAWSLHLAELCVGCASFSSEQRQSVFCRQQKLITDSGLRKSKTCILVCSTD